MEPILIGMSVEEHKALMTFLRELSVFDVVPDVEDPEADHLLIAAIQKLRNPVFA